MTKGSNSKGGAVENVTPVTYLATEKMMRSENGAANCGMMSLEAWSNWVSSEFVAQW